MSGNVKANGDVKHIDHFVVAVMEPERAEKFFTEVMGARTLKSENEPKMTRIFMKLGENHIGLFSQGTISCRNARAPTPIRAIRFKCRKPSTMAWSQRIRQASPFVRELKSEGGLGCCWNDGLVFQDSEGNFWEITKTPGIAKTRLHHLHFDSTDIGASVEFYKRFMNCTVRTQNNAMAEIVVPSGQSVILNKVDELSDVTKATWRGRHFAFYVNDDDFHAIVDKLHAAGIEERDEHGERAGRKPGQLGTYFREPSGFRLQITNEDSATFAAHAND